MEWLEVMVKTPVENQELVSNILYEAGVTGLAIEDPQDIIDLSSREEDWDFIDESILEFEEGVITIKAYFPESESLMDTIAFIKNKIENNHLPNGNRPLGKMITSKIEDKDWSETWKKHYKPTKMGKNILIKPSWEAYEKKPNEIIIELDPGMAFGTGTHETTIMCTEALEEYLRPGDSVFDVGCGSGILSIVAAKLGAEEVIGIDMDELAVMVAKDNIKISGVEEIVEIRKGNLLDTIKGKSDIIVANIIAEVIVAMTKDIGGYLNDNGIFITSGIILDKIDKVENALRDNQFKIINKQIMNEWACIIATKI